MKPTAYNLIKEQARLESMKVDAAPLTLEVLQDFYDSFIADRTEKE